MIKNENKYDAEANTQTVGIITLPGNFNYGNKLQLHAVQRIYLKLGWTPISLELSTYRDPLSRIRKVYRWVRGIKSAEDMMAPERRAAFKRFTANIPAETISDPFKGVSNRFDMFSVGSDQVWNPKFIRYESDWYFLKFARKEQRIALAPSIGIDALTPNQAKLIRSGVQGFSTLSVRERRGAELIKECSGRDAEVICDPTLVLPATEWRNVADGRLTPQKPYIFTYLLGGIGAEAADVLERVTESGTIPVVPLSDRQKPSEPDAGPAEFIDLIDHASHVVTDSFHAAVFSSILQTPLTIVHREGGASMFSRLEQLARALCIEEKIYGSPTYDLSQAGNYDGVCEAISRERSRFVKYLKAALNA